jgi:hypothetical protein
MNTKLNFAFIVVTMFLIATACSPEISSLPILDPAQPGELSNAAPGLPVTGKESYEAVQRAYDFEQEIRAYPSRKSHSACLSADIQRQGECVEQEQTGSAFLSGNGYVEALDYPNPKLHSACVSEDLQRQKKCME